MPQDITAAGGLRESNVEGCGFPNCLVWPMRAPSAHQELVDVHAGVDGDLATEIILKLLLPHGAGGVVCQKLREALQRCYTAVGRQ